MSKQTNVDARGLKVKNYAGAMAKLAAYERVGTVEKFQKLKQAEEEQAKQRRENFKNEYVGGGDW